MIALFLWATEAQAHVSEQGLVLLLPTDFYLASGVLVVILTLVLVLLMPAALSARLFRGVVLLSSRLPCLLCVKARAKVQTAFSVVSLSMLLVLLCFGLFGTRDPLENLLPLFIWTIWWIGFPLLQCVVGDVWRWVNPWAGVSGLLSNAGWRSPLTLPAQVGQWPAVVVFLLATSFGLADIAPDAPVRLALFVAGYFVFTLLCIMLYGKQWLYQGECFSILLQRYSQLSIFASHSHSVRLGLPGWKLIADQVTTYSAATFILILLGCGSFDGLNETFVWLAAIGVNPLEFPGRSAVITETVLGLLATNLLLILIYALCVYAGLWRANRSLAIAHQVSFKKAFCALSVSVLPIALVYHFAHYLVTLLVNGQYVMVAISDPLANGSDYLNLGSYYVSTGFLNTPASVKTIWLTQAVSVVVGHVLSVLMAHTVAVQLFGNARRAIVSQAPLAVFMVIYTFIGLWLLAAPKGA